METLDKFDIAILSALQSNGRLSNTDLAQRVGLSAAPCWRRVRALEENGFITGYHAELNRHKIGLGVLAFVRVDAERNNLHDARMLEDALAERQSVLVDLGTTAIIPGPPRDPSEGSGALRWIPEQRGFAACPE